MIAGTMGAVALHGLGPASASPADEESCFVSAINSARGAAGVAPLSIQGDLLRISRVWSQTMSTAGHIFHNTNIANLVPSNWQTVGENVGTGPTCDSIAEAFMNSPEHRRNILDSAFTTVGVGVVDSPNGTVWVTEDFMGTGAGLPVPIVAKPAPKVTVPPTVTVPEPKVTTPAPKAVVAAPSPRHTEPSAPAKPRPFVPAPSPSHVVTGVETPVARPTSTPIPVATPILDRTLTGDQASDPPHTGPAHPSHGVFSAIASFFSHLL
jgi:hypothetical protein